MKERKHLAILGSTGSIGVQALEVVRAHPEEFLIEALIAGNNYELLIQQSLEFKPNVTVIGNKAHYDKVFAALDSVGIKVYTGKDAINSVMEMATVDLVLTAVVGYAGLQPTLAAIRSGKNIALANKETLVIAGELVTREAMKSGVNIYPVDSEHSAIFQCLMGELDNPIEKVILTCSGGPFLGKSRDYLSSVTKIDALKHPNWDMGDKITIDSATLMNKGLEVIEAKWLFGLDLAQIEVVIHPQSIIHSMVQFKDGSIKAQLGLPDMRIPIQFALSYPERLESEFPRFSFADYPSLTFGKPDTASFRNLALAFEAVKNGGNQPCILNAANEVAVNNFLEERIGFLQMSELVETCLAKVAFIKSPTYDDYIQTDTETRHRALEIIR